MLNSSESRTTLAPVVEKPRGLQLCPSNRSFGMCIKDLDSWLGREEDRIQFTEWYANNWYGGFQK